MRKRGSKRRIQEEQDEDKEGARGGNKGNKRKTERTQWLYDENTPKAARPRSNPWIAVRTAGWC